MQERNAEKTKNTKADAHTSHNPIDWVMEQNSRKKKSAHPDADLVRFKSGSSSDLNDH